MRMVRFTNIENGLTFWFPAYDILYIAEQDGRTMVSVKDRTNGSSSWDFRTVEPAEDIIAQL